MKWFQALAYFVPWRKCYEKEVCCFGHIHFVRFSWPNIFLVILNRFRWVVQFLPIILEVAIFDSFRWLFWWRSPICLSFQSLALFKNCLSLELLLMEIWWSSWRIDHLGALPFLFIFLLIFRTWRCWCPAEKIEKTCGSSLPSMSSMF